MTDEANGKRVTTKEFYTELISQNDKREKMHNEIKDILLPLVNQVASNKEDIAFQKKRSNISDVIGGLAVALFSYLGFNK